MRNGVSKGTSVTKKGATQWRMQLQPTHLLGERMPVAHGKIDLGLLQPSLHQCLLYQACLLSVRIQKGKQCALICDFILIVININTAGIFFCMW